jgi:RNA polymerase-interacting CarD/CdnL/TRCF family regulator
MGSSIIREEEEQGNKEQAFFLRCYISDNSYDVPVKAINIIGRMPIKPQYKKEQLQRHVRRSNHPEYGAWKGGSNRGRKPP